MYRVRGTGTFSLLGRVVVNDFPDVVSSDVAIESDSVDEKESV